jgi:RecG-like helicase
MLKRFFGGSKFLKRMNPLMELYSHSKNTEKTYRELLLLESLIKTPGERALYELNRAGQIFFVHNRVEELQSIHDILHRLIPDMKICIAHGQMEAKVLENKILDFMAGDYDMLLCTTIIESGLDIPNANTIIINQAQNIGLSDLHQLRGRVGRSNKRAFCYLMVPPLVSITEDARRRLKAIESRGKAEPNCGVIKKLNRQLRNLGINEN